MSLPAAAASNPETLGDCWRHLDRSIGSFFAPPDNSDLLAVSVIPSSNSLFSLAAGGGHPGEASGASASVSKHRLFLVVDLYQIVLVEPDATRLGWGVAVFAGFLQDLEVVSDKEDSRCLHVTVHGPSRITAAGVAATGTAGGGRSSSRPSFASPSPTSSHPNLRLTSAAAKSSAAPLLSAKFLFDDHIRCMAAKQRYPPKD